MFSTLKKLVSYTALTTAVSIAPYASADYSQHTEAAAFIDKMVNEYGLNKEHVQAVLKDAKKQQSILDAIARPAEKTKPWYEYRKIFLGESRITQGVTFWNENAETLAKAAKEFGVPEHIIVAIIGVETRYGKHAGSYRVIDALATLGFDYPPRSKFFAKELENFLLLTSEQKQNPLKLKGSYAGAMGYGQFMPSSYRAYAVDFDGDKKADIWNNPKDAIGSVANYFRAHRWQEGQPVMVEANVAEGFDESILDSRAKPSLTAREIAQKGVTPAEGRISDDTMLMPLSYDGEQGKQYWLGYKNFYVITRYNRSHMYARAVWELSEEVKARYYSQESQ